MNNLLCHLFCKAPDVKDAEGISWRMEIYNDEKRVCLAEGLGDLREHIKAKDKYTRADTERITDLETEVAALDALFKKIGKESRKRGRRVKVLEDALEKQGHYLRVIEPIGTVVWLEWKKARDNVKQALTPKEEDGLDSR